MATKVVQHPMQLSITDWLLHPRVVCIAFVAMHVLRASMATQSAIGAAFRFRWLMLFPLPAVLVHQILANLDM
ncbi:hypothetical protein C4577_04855 [Candidatus Parcubacteria bacterium]|nr:MAG: hypothetical protein C4577_04855 [Candidatus Parcubacteria bacterium]